MSTFAGSATRGATDGVGAAASFNYPYGIAADRFGNMYVVDAGNINIRRITPAGVVTTIAGSGSVGSADGVGTSASFLEPLSIAVDANGIVYVNDSGNRTIRKLTPN